MVKITGNLPYGATPIDDYSELIPDHISTVSELYELELANNLRAQLDLLSKTPAPERMLTTEVLKDIHRKMFGNIWEWAGKFRKNELNIGVDSSQIAIEIRKLRDDLTFWQQHHDNNEIVACLHHRLVWIHPFQNGNGRWARMVVNLYLKNSGKPMLKWPEAKLYQDISIREEYISALQQADKGFFEELIAFHERLK